MPRALRFVFSDNRQDRLSTRQLKTWPEMRRPIDTIGMAKLCDFDSQADCADGSVFSHWVAKIRKSGVRAALWWRRESQLGRFPLLGSYVELYLRLRTRIADLAFALMAREFVV